jgi:hypothetical protein
MHIRSLSLLGSLSAMLVLASCDNKQADSGPADPNADTPYKRYGVQQAHVRYEASGHRRGTEELYFVNHGRREARIVNVENLTEQGARPERSVAVSHGSDMRIADMIMRRGTRLMEPVVDSLMRLEKVDPPTVISDNVLKRMGLVKKGTGEVLGYPVTVWYNPNSGMELSTWNGIVLKQEINRPEYNHLVVAVSIDTVGPIPDSIFTPPAGIEFNPAPKRPVR